MPSTTLFVLLLLFLLSTITATPSTTSRSFHFEGFNAENLTLSNSSTITDGLLHLTDDTAYVIGHAFFPTPLPLKHSASFSAAFVFAISYPDEEGGDGMAFALSPSPTLPHSSAGHYLGLFNKTSNSNSSNHMLAIVLDTIKNVDFDDISDNYVGVNINGLTSETSSNASYYQTGEWKGLDLHSGEAMQLWVEYNASNSLVEVTLAPLRLPKPETPLLQAEVNLSSILAEETYVGFSAATGAAHGYHYVLGWSFSMSGEPLQGLDLDALPPVMNHSKPELPEEQPAKQSLNIMIITVIVSSVILGTVLVTLSIGGVRYWLRTKRRFEELIEDEELLCGPNRISYKDLYKATEGFKEENLSGAGGSGRVYKGTLPKSHARVAVKKISHDSSHGVKEFVAEITSMARLKHKNLVQLIGYCRRRGELLVVYEYMENGSLDKFLYGPRMETLSWEQRFRVARGVAEGLLYLHEGWEQVVVHRDVKASNVLLDADFNGRLGDFGLAKLYDRGQSHQQTTRVVGTLGYMAPEMACTGKASTFTDVFAFGAFLLELVSGRRPIVIPRNREGMEGTPVFLVDRVLELWRRDNILAAIDSRLGSEYKAEEAETLLELGVLCSHKVPASRPRMRQVVQVLEGDLPLHAALPESCSGAEMSSTVVTVAEGGEAPMSSSFPCPMEQEGYRGNEFSSLTVEANSLSLRGDNRDLYAYVVW